MIRPTSFIARTVSVVSVFTLFNLGVPMSAVVTFGQPLGDWVRQRQKAAASVPKPEASRLLSAKEMRTLQGRLGENPYLAGAGKWAINYKGVDLMTGNFSMSATDLTFEGGYGIPVNVTRSYSANCGDEGPFGKGWTLSADVRSTAGGLLKKSGAPVRSIPTHFAERPTAQSDPNLPASPIEAVVTTDAGGTEETIQKDLDGILTTPPWDKNVIDSTYEMVTLNGSLYQVLLSNTLKTIDGSVYVYQKRHLPEWHAPLEQFRRDARGGQRAQGRLCDRPAGQHYELHVRSDRRSFPKD